MNVLIACEHSGRVRDAFIKRDHNAISCDLMGTDIPGPHIMGNIFSGILSYTWDLIIAHPDCRFLCVSGNRWHAGSDERYNAAAFVEKLWKVNCDKVCIENPVGVINSIIKSMPRPQYIQPYQFGHAETKKTGLWKRGLPDLIPTKIVEPEYIIGRDGNRYSKYHYLSQWSAEKHYGMSRQKVRSLTYQGIANAMAEQWG